MAVNEIHEFVKGLSYAEFTKDRKTINAVIRSLEVIGEATKNIPKTLRDKYPDIPWQKMAGMRDKLIHEYFGVDLEIIWQAINHDLPLIQPSLLRISKEFIPNGQP